MTSSRNSVIVSVIAAGLALTACGSGSEAVSSVTTQPDATVTQTPAEPEQAAAPAGQTSRPDVEPVGFTELDERIDVGVNKLAAGYVAVDGVWEGYDPNKHPVVLVFKDNVDEVVTLVAVNHPKAGALGDATAMSTVGTPFRTLHRVNNPADRETLEGIEPFNFQVQLGGVDSFAIKANAGRGGDFFFDVEASDYTATVLHEMFHRYQEQAFTRDVSSQDVDGYDYTAQNLELAALEERALREAVMATDDAARKVAAERFAALRLARRAGDERVELDDGQERFEGTARYIEHRLAEASSDDGFAHTADNYGYMLTTQLEPSNVKDIWGFGRFYASGAAVLRILEKMDGANVEARIEAGESPADILIDQLGLTEADTATLVAEARLNYDPLDELPVAAEKAAEAAQSEPDPFGGMPEGLNLPEGVDLDGGRVPITPEEEACLAEQGSTPTDGGVITDEQFEACFSNSTS